MYTHSTKPDVASVFGPIDHEFTCHDKFMLPKTRSVAAYPNGLHRFPLLGTTTEKTCGCPINFTLKIMFRNDERFRKSPQSSRPTYNCRLPVTYHHESSSRLTGPSSRSLALTLISVSRNQSKLVPGLFTALQTDGLYKFYNKHHLL